jgi:hypothetical protein
VIQQVLIIPVITSFGLIFKDKFHALNLTAFESTLILNLNSALGMTLGKMLNLLKSEKLLRSSLFPTGLFNGVLLKCFGYRKIAFLGGALFSGGLVATSWANSFRHFLITYSIITCMNKTLLQVLNLIYVYIFKQLEWVCAVLRFHLR